MIKIISFDLDGTLMKSTYADLVWLEGLPQIYASEKKVDIEKSKQYILQEYDKIGYNKVEWYDISYWFKHFDLKSNWKDLLDKYVYAVEVYPEVPNVIKRLYRNFDLIIISNAKREFIEIELDEIGLREYFTYVYSSTSDFHKVKKIPEFYQMICDKLQITSYEMIHVGDHKEFDYIAPKNIGIKSFYLNRDGTNNKEHVVSDLEEFEKRVNFLSD